MGDITSQSSIARHDANSAMMSISSKILVVTVIIVFLMLALLFIVHIYAKWYWSRHVHEDSRIVSWRRRTALAHQGPAGARTRGLDSRALELVPEVEFDPKEFHEGLECAVCLSEVTLGEKIRLLPKCNHGFHVTCIDMWFHSHTTCPLCRTPVVFDQNNIHLQEIEVSSSSESESESDSETRVRSFRQPSEEASTSTTSSGNELVIDIPRQVFCEDCLSSPRLGDNCDGESSKSPVLTTLRSFRRLLSRGKRVVPSPHGSSSVETEQV